MDLLNFISVGLQTSVQFIQIKFQKGIQKLIHL